MLRATGASARALGRPASGGGRASASRGDLPAASYSRTTRWSTRLAVARWLIEQACAKGRRYCAARYACRIARPRLCRCLADGTRLAAGRVVNAAGRPPRGSRRDCRSARAKVTWSSRTVTADSSGGSSWNWAMSRARRARPASRWPSTCSRGATGQILIGSSRQYDNESGEIETAILGRMLRRACDYLPGLPRLTAIRAWTGFRPATADKLPLIGPWPETPGLYLAAGHEGLGITNSLATGELLADMIAGRKSKIAREPYLPARVCRAGQDRRSERRPTMTAQGTSPWWAGTRLDSLVPPYMLWLQG